MAIEVREEGVVGSGPIKSLKGKPAAQRPPPQRIPLPPHHAEEPIRIPLSLPLSLSLSLSLSPSLSHTVLTPFEKRKIKRKNSLWTRGAKLPEQRPMDGVSSYATTPKTHHTRGCWSGVTLQTGLIVGQWEPVVSRRRSNSTKNGGRGNAVSHCRSR